MSISVIFLAGGKGARMGSKLPKQFLSLNGTPLVTHSLRVFLSLDGVKEVIVVTAPQYQHYFEDLPVKFALPGKERQDSVYNGLQATDATSEWVCVHDGVRPFINVELVKSLFTKGKKSGAAALGLPTKETIKETTHGAQVAKTLDRSKLWEIQTPQFIKKEILEAGFAYAHRHQLAVTDDVALAELIDHPVQLIPGSNWNIKITTPEDFAFAEWVLASGFGAVQNGV